MSISKISRYVPEDVWICQSNNPERIHHELAEHNRHFIEALIIQEGMPETSVMIGDCQENSPKIPVRITNGNNIADILY